MGLKNSWKKLEADADALKGLLVEARAILDAVVTDGDDVKEVARKLSLDLWCWVQELEEAFGLPHQGEH